MLVLLDAPRHNRTGDAALPRKLLLCPLLLPDIARCCLMQREVALRKGRRLVIAGGLFCVRVCGILAVGPTRLLVKAAGLTWASRLLELANLG